MVVIRRMPVGAIKPLAAKLRETKGNTLVESIVEMEN